jgi:3D (Asp-Asp-Asp) domain-containing protein
MTQLSLILMMFSMFTVVSCGPNYALRDQRSSYGEDFQDFGDLPLPPPSQSPVILPPEQGGSENPTLPAPPVTQNPGNSQSSEDPQKVYIGLGTVYYMPVYGEKRNCPESEYSLMKDENDKVLVRLCKEEVRNCALQGSCFYVDGKEVVLYAYRKMVRVEVPGAKETVVQPRFRINKEVDRCPQGMGANRICLDPYRSIAADPDFHKKGDVVYLPTLVGVKLPNGETHDGYFVVRDQGGAIKGEGRFDFFIGFDDYRGHLFSQLNLADKKKSRFQYYKVPEAKAREIREARRFPLAPESVHQQALASMMKAVDLRKTAVAENPDMGFFRMKFGF